MSYNYIYSVVNELLNDPVLGMANITEVHT